MAWYDDRPRADSAGALGLGARPRHHHGGVIQRWPASSLAPWTNSGAVGSWWRGRNGNGGAGWLAARGLGAIQWGGAGHRQQRSPLFLARSADQGVAAQLVLPDRVRAAPQPLWRRAARVRARWRHWPGRRVVADPARASARALHHAQSGAERLRAGARGLADTFPVSRAAAGYPQGEESGGDERYIHHRRADDGVGGGARWRVVTDADGVGLRHRGDS